MTIKKRPLTAREREAAIDEFGRAAGVRPLDRSPNATIRPERPKLKPILLRLDESQHALLQQTARRQRRSMHNLTMLIPIDALTKLNRQ
jgi:hypothetical protein